MHRGSNNRLDEENFDRTNANRLFDSQNNDRGGYNVGSLYYYAGSTLQIEWTNQHSCNNSKSHCELVIQYMCDDLVRDGATTDRIPYNHTLCRNFNCNTDLEYGMHENYDYYDTCYRRERNKGLFIADQKLKKDSAIYTRQNPNGNRRGYECPEERDYYPYWHPTPWRDVVVMTNDPHRCPYYRNNTENVKSRWACLLDTKTPDVIPNNKPDCDKKNGKWTEFPAHDIPAPDCRETEFTRDNHLGNGIGGHPNTYNWTVPNFIHDKCVLRIRYNVSTDDYDPWNTTAANNEIKRNAGSLVDIYTRYKLTEVDGRNRGYKFEDNPEVKVFEEADFKLELAINTEQYGRVFQDRSHAFAIKKRIESLKDKTVHNLNVRGKRGNIVQVYPAVEYDFVPNTLEMSTKDVIHIQWTGSNTNPKEAEGNGKAQTDRSNVVQLTSQVYPEGDTKTYGPGLVYGHYGNNYPIFLNQSQFLGLPSSYLEALAYLGTMNENIMHGQFGGEMSELDDAGTYFDLGPRNVTKTGTFHYMCTRNNDFTNRDQKGRIIVYPYSVTYHSLGWAGGSASVTGGTSSLLAKEGTFDKLQKLRLEEWSIEEGKKKLEEKGKTISLGEEYASRFFVILPAERLTTTGKEFTVNMALTMEDNDNIKVYRSNPATFSSWSKVDSHISGGTIQFQTAQGGVFVARTTLSNVSLIVGLVLGLLLVIIIVTGTVCYFRRRPENWVAVKSKVNRMHKSTQNQV
ncbi:hypothetical protein ScPMuIL_008819 [Solemya velum]